MLNNSKKIVGKYNNSINEEKEKLEEINNYLNSEINGTRDITTLEEVIAKLKEYEMTLNYYKARIEKLENKENYSNEEIIVGKWIDNKPIYRKVVQLSSISSSDLEKRRTFSFDKVLTGVESIISIEGTYTTGNATVDAHTTKNLGNSPMSKDMESQGGAYIYCYNNDIEILIYDPVSFNTQSVSVTLIIEYTKVSDNN